MKTDCVSNLWVVRLDGSRELSREVVGGKAWSVNHMRAMGIPTPPAVVMTIEACRAYLDHGRLPAQAWGQLVSEIQTLETATGRVFGGSTRPLLVSVRSGAARSMPGMMDTILNLGLNDTDARALARESGDALFAADTRQRFEHEFKATVLGNVAAAVPVDPIEQLRLAVLAVFDSWNAPRARAYRAYHGLPESAGTAVTIQAMVFGNLDERSGAGVLFSRNPLTGERAPFGEWLMRAQGEDVVSGRHTPEPLDQMCSMLPDAHRELLEIAARLEADARDIQDIEFTVQSGRLWLLQTRPAKRSARAAVHLAVTLCEEGLIRIEEALSRVSPDQVRNLLRPQLDPSALAQARLLASGEPACPGFALGAVVTDSTAAIERAEREDVILTRHSTSPDDIHGMIAARGIVTAVGGATSHAAVISREIGVPCVVGCGEAALHALEGRTVTVDGATGKIYDGRIQVVASNEEHDRDMAQLIRWAQTLAPLPVYVPGEALPTAPVELTGPPERWISVAPARGAAGAALDTDAGVAGAVRAGFAFLVVPHRLPALLGAIRAVASKP